MAPRTRSSIARASSAAADDERVASEATRATPARQSRRTPRPAASTPLPPVETSNNLAFGSQGTPEMEINRTAANGSGLATVLEEPVLGTDGAEAQSPSERAARRSTSHRPASPNRRLPRTPAAPLDTVAEESFSSLPAAAAMTQPESAVPQLSSATAVNTSMAYKAPIAARQRSAVVHLWRGQSAPARAPATLGSSPAAVRAAALTSPPDLRVQQSGAPVGEDTANITPDVAQLAEHSANFVKGNLPAIRGAVYLVVALMLSHLLLAFFLPSLQPATIIQNLVADIARSAESAKNASVHSNIYDANLYDRMAKVETDISSLKFEWAHIQQRLPETIAVTKDPDTGELIIPKDFISALTEQLKHELNNPPGTSEQWTTFLETNQNRIEAFVSSVAEKHAADRKTTFDQKLVQSWIDNGIIVSQATFVETLDRHTARIVHQCDQQCKQLIANFAETMDNRPSTSTRNKFLDTWILTQWLKRQDMVRKRNYASWHAGAAVDYMITSPTWPGPPQVGLLATLWTWFPFRSRYPNPPETALLPWTEAGESWCAARSSRIPGKGQLGIVLPRPIRPTHLVLENVRAAEMYDSSRSPKKIEIWGKRVRSKDSAVAAKEGTCTGPPPNSPGSWLCLGTGDYDIHEDINFETFSLVSPVWNGRKKAVKDPHAVLVNRVAIRIVETWGDSEPCIYRIRVMGQDLGEVTDDIKNGQYDF